MYCDFQNNTHCTTIHTATQIFSTRYLVTCKVYTGYRCKWDTAWFVRAWFVRRTVDNPLAEARGLSLRTGAQTMLYLLLESLEISIALSAWHILSRGIVASLSLQFRHRK